MTLSVEPEVGLHNVSQRRQRRTEPRPQATFTKNSVKFGCAVFELCERTDRQTDRHTQHNTPHPSRGRSNFSAGCSCVCGPVTVRSELSADYKMTDFNSTQLNRRSSLLRLLQQAFQFVHRCLSHLVNITARRAGGRPHTAPSWLGQ